MTARAGQVLDKLLKTASMTTFPDGERVLDLEIIKATRSPNVRGVPLKTFTKRQASAARDGAFSSEVMDSTEQDGSRAASEGRGTRGELVKMLSALEEFHKLINSTLSHRITIMPRGAYLQQRNFNKAKYRKRSWEMWFCVHTTEVDWGWMVFGYRRSSQYLLLHSAGLKWHDGD